VGEIHLDDFEVTHTKDDILWEGTEQEQVEARLRASIADLITIAAQPRGKRQRTPSRTATLEASELVAREIRARSPIPRVSANGRAAATLAGLSPILNRIRSQPATLESTTADGPLRLYLTSELEAHDPYTVVEAGDGTVIVINLNHVAAPDGLDGTALIQYLRDALLDALTSSTLAAAGETDAAVSMLSIKDQLLRLWSVGSE
jgi:hypothetical protein